MLPRSPSLFACAVLVAVAAPVSAQTTNPLFAAYRFAPPELGSRPAGLGGAFVGLADSVQAAVANPAGLTLIPISEVALASQTPWAGAAFGRQRFRVAGYVVDMGNQRADLAPAYPTTGGFVDSSVREAGIAAGVRLHTRVRLGASLAWSRLDLYGERVDASIEGVETVASTVRSDSGHLRGSVGLLVILYGADARALPSLRMGLSVQPGFDWSAHVTGDPLGAAAPVEIRRPSVVSGGLALRAADRWTILAQGDIVRYSEVRDTLARNVGEVAAEGFRMANVLEPRVGAEFSAPLWCGCGSVKLRGGLHYRSPGTLVYDGPDADLARAFAPGTWSTVGTAGASFFAEYYGHGIRLDIDSQDLVHGPDLSFGIVWRF
jgi:hypothetical protein